MTTTAPPLDVPLERIQVDPPPQLPDSSAGGAALMLVPLLGSLGSVAMVAGPGGHSAARYVAAGLVVLATATLVVLQVARQRALRARQLEASRAAYRRHLANVRDRAREVASKRREELVRRHPPPDALPTVVALRDDVRRPDDPSFLQVRGGAGRRPVAELVGSGGPDADPVAAAQLRALVHAHTSASGLPLTLDLRTETRIDVAGDSERARSLARSLVCSAVAAHAPEDLVVAVLAHPSVMAAWDWVKWLPHSRAAGCDAVGPARLLRSDLPALAELLPGPGPSGRPAPHLVIVVDGAGGVPEERVGATVVVVAGTPGRGRVLDADAADADQCHPAVAEALARQVARRSGRASGSGHPADLKALLAQLPAGTRLRVPIGTGEDGPLVLDLNEPARGGVGPHGLLIGATGSGKSKLLRTLVLGLALTHRPDQLHLALVDFKGGATFAGLAALPHVAALITNLEDDGALVTRMRDALGGELVRRQQLLRDVGLGSFREHEEAVAAGAVLPALAPLLVVVDEFTELLAAQPDLIDLFTSIGRIGRSLGVHLLLASQRLEEGRLRGLESHLSYRIALRTLSAQESRAVLGVADAHELPARPGAGYLRCGPGDLRRFTAAYVSGPGAPVRPVVAAGTVLPFTAAEVAGPVPVAAASTPSLLDRAVRRLAGTGPRARPLWLPPLDRSAALAGDLIRDLARDPQRGWVSPSWRAAGPLIVPIGSVDRPREQRHDTLRLDLAGAAGHIAVVGGPRVGKSTLLQTLVVGLALTSTPQEVQVFALDLGGALAPLGGLPHVSAIAGRSDPEVARRAVAEALRLLDRREQHFGVDGIGSIESYRRRRAAGDPGDGYGDVVVIVDDWGALRAELTDLEPALGRLLTRGLAFGIHVVVSALRWSDLRTSTRDLFGTRLELRLGDPADSMHGRASAQNVPSRPGHGLIEGPLHFLGGLPCRAGGTTGDLVAEIARAWPGPRAPRLLMLPARVVQADLPSAVCEGRGLVLGVVEDDLAPLVVDVDAEPHLLVLGDAGSGRTNLLRTYCREVARTRTPTEARLLLVDPRRTLAGVVAAPHVLSHLRTYAESEAAMAELATYLARRLDQDVGARGSRGADVFVVIDDEDLVTTGAGSPLQPLAPLLPRADEVGLHVVLARRTGGAARALHQPVLQQLRDLGGPALLLAGDPDEGPVLGGLRPRRAPPGRARLLARGVAASEVQLVWTDPSP